MNTEPPSHDTESPAPYTIEQILSGIVMGLIVLITFGNVLARYFTSQSFAATEEFSIALLIVLSFLGSSAAFAFDRHIRVDFFVRKLPPGTLFALQTRVQLGPLQDGRYPVISGLDSGARVIRSNLLALRHGLPVQLAAAAR